MDEPGGSIVVVANRWAGAADGVDDAIAVLGAGGRTVVAVDLGDPLGLDEAMREAACGPVVAAGGDGTLHMLVQHLWHRGVLGETVLGLVPLGTGNDLARTLGIPLDPEAAAAVVTSGRSRPLDLLVDDAGAVGVNAVHCGVGGLAAERADPLKPLLGRVAYRVGAAWAGARTPGWQVVVEVDGRVLVQGNVLFVGIGNGTTIGGGTVLWPDARPDDGVADVVVATAAGARSRLEVAAALRSGDPGRADGIATGRGTWVRVVGEPVPWIADGDPAGSRPSRSWRVHGSAWRLLVPGADGG